jgi:hypothetical protein
MFDGTDLSVAYGGYNSGHNDSNSFNNPYQHMQAPPEPPQIPKATGSHAMKPEPEYNPPTAMYMQQQPTAKPSSYAPPSDSVWDRIALKKWEVFKFFVMSLIIVLGLSIDSVLSHYITSYIGKSFLTENQEMFVRLSYPVGIILLIWMLKVSF